MLRYALSKCLRSRGRRARLDLAVERGLTPLVGSDRPLATLGELFAEVKAGRGRVVFGPDDDSGNLRDPGRLP
jgi:hypothetical protein